MMIYLDNSATTPLCDKAKEAIISAMDCYGNPSSLHYEGDSARALIEKSRKSVINALGAKSGKLVFTSCGSEASNLAIFGTVNAKSRRPANRIITTDSEHPSVSNALEALESQGFEIFKLKTKGGKLDLAGLEEALARPVFMASMMLVNNETGAVYDIPYVFSEIKKKYPDAVCHCDAVQGFLKVKFTPDTLHADMISLSGHKIHAPKGVGALWVSDRIIKEKRIVPTLLGGGQEDGFRSGTENTIGISAFGAAAEECLNSFENDIKVMENVRQYAVEALSKIDGVTVNIPNTAAPHIVNLTLPNIKSQTMLNFLAAKGISVSSGSACSSHSGKPSSTLIAFGLTPLQADCSLRISFSKYTKKNDVDALVAELLLGIKMLVRIKRR